MKWFILAIISFNAFGASVFKDGSYSVKEVRLNHSEINGLCNYEKDFTDEKILINGGKVVSDYSIGVFPQQINNGCELNLKTNKIVDVVLLTSVKKSSVKLEVTAGRFLETESVSEYMRLSEVGFVVFGKIYMFGTETYYLLRPEVKLNGKDSLVFNGNCKQVKNVKPKGKIAELYDSYFGDVVMKCDLENKMGYILLKKD